MTHAWMERESYDFPVLLEGRDRDDGLPRMVADRPSVSVYPTTLFLDRDGGIVFRVTDSSPRLVEEYTWRVEALLDWNR